MQDGVRRLRGVLGIAIAWGLTWGIVGGVVMEGIVDPDGRMVDMWPQLLALSGFVGGLIFSVMLCVSGALAGRRPLTDVSEAHLYGWGALAGLGVAIIASGGPVSFILLTSAGTTSAVLTLVVARRTAHHRVLAAYLSDGLGASPAVARTASSR